MFGSPLARLEVQARFHTLPLVGAPYHARLMNNNKKLLLLLALECRRSLLKRRRPHHQDPGTAKTSTLEIVECFNEEVLRPEGREHLSVNRSYTGKAARELSVATGKPALTLDSFENVNPASKFAPQGADSGLAIGNYGWGSSNHNKGSDGPTGVSTSGESCWPFTETPSLAAKIPDSPLQGLHYLVHLVHGRLYF